MHPSVACEPLRFVVIWANFRATVELVAHTLQFFETLAINKYYKFLLNGKRE